MTTKKLNLYLQCLDIADDYMQMDPHGGNVTAALKQAGADLGIEWGQPMADFLKWAHGQMGL
tara:strand:- start:64 stop:249 length:186 start_codon:yes stop_codon:yes gene_type:complete